MRHHVARTAAAAAALLVWSGVALAHTGAGAPGGFTHGFAHPLGGLDHVLAMMAVGLYAALLGGRALWLVPGSFVGLMATGAALGMAGIAIPRPEVGIALSVVVLGLAVALRSSVPTRVAMALVGFFAIFHGHAHGAEMPQDASGSAYATGFLLATALLHGIGITIGLLAGKTGARAAQAAGGAIAVAGVALLAGIL